MTFALVFPGQGSQTVGMLTELANEYKEISETFSEAADVLGTDYWALAQQGPDTELARTRITQPLMFISGIAVWRALQKAGLGKPVAIAGHSLGEFTALVAAGAIGFKDGLKLVHQRAQFMAAAIPSGEGGMVALLGMDDKDAIAVCNDVEGEGIVEAVNFNAPGQVALSGHVGKLKKAVDLAVERGARKAIMLAVSVPNHSSLMKDAGAQLAEVIDTLKWQQPSIPVVQNAQAVAPEGVDAMLDSLRAHVFSPVQWTKSVETLRDTYNASMLVEVGPGKVLCGLAKRIDRSLPSLPTATPDAVQQVIEKTQTNTIDA